MHFNLTTVVFLYPLSQEIVALQVGWNVKEADRYNVALTIFLEETQSAAHVMCKCSVGNTVQ